MTNDKFRMNCTGLRAALRLCLLSWFLLFAAASVWGQQSDSLSTISTDTVPINKKGSKMGGGGTPRPPQPLRTDSSKTASVDTLAPKPPIEIKKEKQARAHSPKRAIMWALIAPGGGQIYNRRYWKLPIVYAGLGGLGYWYLSSRIAYRCYRKAYIAVADDDPNTNYICEREPLASARTLELQSQYYRSQSEYALLGFFAFYALCAADAFVDAHLMSFDVGDDLSLLLRPSPTNLGVYLQPRYTTRSLSPPPVF